MSRFSLRVFPMLTLGFIAINTVIYFLLNAEDMWFITSWNSMRIFGLIKGEEAFTSVLTAMFMHADISHLIGNMMFLLIFGWAVEDDLGPFVFILFYVFTGVMAAVAHLLLGTDSKEEFQFMVGASGAVAGVMGGYLVLIPGARIQSFKKSGCFSVGISLYVGLMAAKAIYRDIDAVLNPQEGSYVAHWAHIGGFGSGAVLGMFLRPWLRTHKELGTIRVAPKFKNKQLEEEQAQEEAAQSAQEPALWVNWQAVSRVAQEGGWPPRVLELAQAQERDDLVGLLQRILQNFLKQDRMEDARRVQGLLKLLGERQAKGNYE